MASPYGIGDSSFQAAGCEVGVRALIDQFYTNMDNLPDARAIRRLHAEDLGSARDKLSRFFCGWLGGPKRYQEKYGAISIPGVHRGFAIGTAEKNAWMLCMQLAVDAQPWEEEFKRYLMQQLAVPADRVRTQP